MTSNMPNTLEYKGFVGRFWYIDGDENLHGVVLGTNDMIHFQGRDVAELRQSLQQGVEDYLAWCRAEGREPEKPYSGKFNVRIPPSLHRRVALLAQSGNMSLNEWLIRALTQEADREQALKAGE